MELPLSGLDIAFREPDGQDEALIAELPPGMPMATGIVLLERLARVNRDEPLRPAQLALSDFEAALVGLRCHLSGPEATSEPYCAACGERVELNFSFEALAESSRPRPAPGVVPQSDGGSLDGIRFRLPTAADARACEGRADAENLLWAACVGERPEARLRRRIERAMSRLAPLLSRVVAVPCAACGAVMRALIHVPTYVVEEISWAARSIFEDVHLLATAYGWREPEILALPRARRRRYAARIRAAG